MGAHIAVKSVFGWYEAMNQCTKKVLRSVQFIPSLRALIQSSLNHQAQGKLVPVWLQKGHFMIWGSIWGPGHKWACGPSQEIFRARLWQVGCPIIYDKKQVGCPTLSYQKIVGQPSLIYMKWWDIPCYIG